MQECYNCKFFKEGGISPGDNPEYRSGWGYCHRHPPTVDPKDTGSSISPNVFDDEWCGEWKHNGLPVVDQFAGLKGKPDAETKTTEEA